MTTVNATTRKDLDVPHVKGDPTKPAPDTGLRGRALLDEIIRMAEEHPDNFDMSNWAVIFDPPIDWEIGVPETCGTAMCVAGWAAHLTGARMIYDQAWTPTHQARLTAQNVEVPEGVTIPREWERHTYGFGHGNRMTIASYAAMVLGISSGYAVELFDAGNTLQTVKDIRDNLVEWGTLV